MLDLSLNETIEAEDEALPYAEEDWENSEQTEPPKNSEPNPLFSTQTRQSDRTRNAKKSNPYGEDFVVDKMDLEKIVEDLVSLEEILVSEDLDIVDEQDKK